jgi:hypothetical protein
MAAAAALVCRTVMATTAEQTARTSEENTVRRARCLATPAMSSGR